MGIKMIQWGTGNVGREMLRVILTRGDFDLVGVHAWSEEKVGVDAGELAGVDVMAGVTATNDVDALLQSAADCVMYTPFMPDIDVLVRFLEAGINVLTTANFLRGDYLHLFGAPGAREALQAAGERGGASLFAGGYNPGFITQLLLVLSTIHSRVDSIEIEESGDASHYDSAMFFQVLGWGQPMPAEGAERPMMAAMLDGFLYDSLDLVAEACRFEVTDRVVTVEYAATPKEIVHPAMTFPAGSIAGQRTCWQYMSDDTVVISVTITWFIGDELKPNLAEGMSEGEHLITIHGEPTVDVTAKLRAPKNGDHARRVRDGMIATGMNVLNAAAAVCAAPPGVRSYIDMPPIPGIAPVEARSIER